MGESESKLPFTIILIPGPGPGLLIMSRVIIVKNNRPNSDNIKTNKQYPKIESL